MKSFNAFRIDTVNHLLLRDEDRIPITPKAFDVLAYLVEHAGQVVTQDEVFDALWSESYVNPEILRKYILEIRKALGDRPVHPEFIETLPRRGYRFVAPVVDDSDEPSALTSNAIEKEVEPATSFAEQNSLLGRHRRWFLAIPLVLILAAGALVWHDRVARYQTAASSAGKPSIAVLPFVNMDLTKDQEYFSEGLSEQLINDLAKVSGLKVVGRSSSFQFKGQGEDLHEVGRKLGVANILEGTVRHDGDHVRVTAELVKAEDGFQLWSQAYDRDIKDIFSVEDEISQAATGALRLKLLGGDGRPVALNAHSTNPEVYQAYLQAQYLAKRGFSMEDSNKALALINSAIKLDDTYAPLWALRASIENAVASLGTESTIGSAEGFRKARNDAERAIELDPALASGYVALANTQIVNDWDWDAANTSINRAEALEPGSVAVIRIRSYLARILGNLDQAIKLGQQSIVLDPLHASSHGSLGYTLYAAERYEEAHIALQKSLDLNAKISFAHLVLGEVLLAEGKPQQALVEFEKESDEALRLMGEGVAYHALGREGDSNRALATLIARHSTEAAYQIVQIYAYRGQTDKAFEWIDRAYKQRDPGLPTCLVEPLFKNLRHDPRYTELLKKMHLPT